MTHSTNCLFASIVVELLNPLTIDIVASLKVEEIEAESDSIEAESDSIEDYYWSLTIINYLFAKAC